MSSYTPNNQTLIEDYEQLKEVILKGAKLKSEWSIGTEHEKLGWSASERRQPPYGGPNGIGVLLKHFTSEGWVPTFEGSAIIALSKNGANLTLEPGGQFELSGAPLKTLAEMSREVDDHLLDMSRLSANLGLIWSGLGSSDIPPNLTPKMPKARYEIMRSYLPQKGKLALHMMHSTCTIQANLDFLDAQDAMKKLRAALYLQPLVMAMFANSFLLDNQLRPGSSARSQIWLNTDPDRYLYPASFLAENTPLDAYIDWAVSVPMFFIARDGQYLNCTGLPFSTFLKEGYQGHQATLGDFELHLSTLFPDARLKQFLEVRGADMGPSSYIKALPTWHVGLLYDDLNLDRVINHFEGISAEQLWETRARLDQEGLDTPLGDRPLIEWAQECTQWAREGVLRYESESAHLLNPLIDNLNFKRCPADLYRPLWEKGGTEAVRKASQVS